MRPVAAAMSGNSFVSSASIAACTVVSYSSSACLALPGTLVSKAVNNAPEVSATSTLAGPASGAAPREDAENHQGRGEPDRHDEAGHEGQSERGQIIRSAEGVLPRLEVADGFVGERHDIVELRGARCQIRIVALDDGAELVGGGADETGERGIEIRCLGRDSLAEIDVHTQPREARAVDRGTRAIEHALTR